MRVLHVVGARPNFMKAAPLVAELRRRGVDQHLLHTGQHYDEAMSKVFFHDLALPRPDTDLGVGSGSHAEQTAKIMLAFEPRLLEVKPDVITVVGDVNSTIACALVAAKCGVRVAHVEAGLRSFDWSMPEEINRVLTDRLSHYLFTPSEDADANLKREGIDADRVHFVGNIMIDSLVQALERARQSDVLHRFGLSPKGYSVLTLHRPANVDDPNRLAALFEPICEAAHRLPVLFPCHPRTAGKIEEHADLARRLEESDVRLVPPLGYLDFLRAVSESRMVVTDSGGLQEETTYLGIPCVTVRDNTERPITVTMGTNILAGTDPQGIRAALQKALEGPRNNHQIPPLWDGQTAPRIATLLTGTTYGPPAT